MIRQARAVVAVVLISGLAVVLGSELLSTPPSGGSFAPAEAFVPVARGERIEIGALLRASALPLATVNAHNTVASNR